MPGGGGRRESAIQRHFQRPLRGRQGWRPAGRRAPGPCRRAATSSLCTCGQARPQSFRGGPAELRPRPLQWESRPRIGPPRTNGRAETARAVSARRSRSSPASNPAARAAFPGAQLSAAQPAWPAARPGARVLPPPPCRAGAHGAWPEPQKLRCLVFEGLVSIGDPLSRPDRPVCGDRPESLPRRG